MIKVRDVESICGSLSYYCPACGEINYIKIENLENYLDTYGVNIPYTNGQTGTQIEFYSPDCVLCGEKFMAVIKLV